MRHEAKCFVLAMGMMLMVAGSAGQKFQLMEASIPRLASRSCCGSPTASSRRRTRANHRNLRRRNGP